MAGRVGADRFAVLAPRSLLEEAALAEALSRGCVLSSSRRQNRRYDFDTFSVLRADRLSYF